MSRVFDANSLEQRYAFLDDCPENLLADVVTLPVGSLPDRVQGVRQWRDALLAGTLPSVDTWPATEVASPVRRALEEMGLARFCKNQPELVDALIKDILSAFARQSEVVRLEIANRLRKLAELERVCLSKQEKARAQRKKRAPKTILLDEEVMRRLREQAERESAGRERDADRGLLAAWGERVRVWTEITEVFGDLGEMMGRGWDLAQGVLRHVGWLDILRLNKLVEHLPQLREIIRALGRLHISANDACVAEKIFVQVRRIEEELLEVRTSHIPTETRGLERSGEIARMLPVESIMLGHPQLRLLWHARRAERSLLTYRIEGIEVERVMVKREVSEEIEKKRPRPERGPIITVLDTSGSMHGLPEQVAKAIVLEAVRTAHAEKRKCFLYAYSGPDQILEHELDLSPEGIGRLLSFIGFTFGGGNDETGVMKKVVARLQEKDWKKADIVFVSDGEWPTPSGLIASVQRARENGTRFHGIQIGKSGRTGLHSICDPVHEFLDWDSVGGWH